MIEFREPPRTGYELRWRMFGIQYRVFPSFFLVAALIIGIICWLKMRLDPVTMAIVIAIDVACLFVAILFTETVQGLVYRSYGIGSTAVIRELIGGIYPWSRPPTAVQRIVVALAAPASAFLLFAIVYYSNQEYSWRKTSPVADLSYFILVVISLFWGVIGLLPIFPHPGGRIALEILSMISPRHGLAMTLGISILVGVAYIAYSAAVYLGYMREVELGRGLYLYASIIVSVFFAFTVLQNWEMLQMIRAQQRGSSTDQDEYDDRAPWER